jgi:hypothetical protein
VQQYHDHGKVLFSSWYIRLHHDTIISENTLYTVVTRFQIATKKVRRIECVGCKEKREPAPRMLPPKSSFTIRKLTSDRVQVDTAPSVQQHSTTSGGWVRRRAHAGLGNWLNKAALGGKYQWQNSQDNPNWQTTEEKGVREPGSD